MQQRKSPVIRHQTAALIWRQRRRETNGSGEGLKQTVIHQIRTKRKAMMKKSVAAFSRMSHSINLLCRHGRGLVFTVAELESHLNDGFIHTCMNCRWSRGRALITSVLEENIWDFYAFLTPSKQCRSIAGTQTPDPSHCKLPTDCSHASYTSMSGQTGLLCL